MSSRNGNLSAKEQEILQRQRKLAASLKPPPPPSAPLLLHQRPKKPPPKKPAAVIDLTRTANVKAAPLPAAPAQKRPSKKRPSVHSSQAVLLAAARKRAAAEQPQNGTAATTATTTSTLPSSSDSSAAASLAPNNKTYNGKPSPKLTRKTLTKSNTPSSLAKLVQNVSTSETFDPAEASSSLPSVEPDDFWKHLRDWDFVSQYANLIRQQKAPSAPSASSSNAAAQADAELGRKPLPDVFVSAHHYKAAWAPLQLAECRAQLLQGALRYQSTPLLVSVKTASSGPRHRGNRNMSADAPWLEEIETGCYVQIRPKQRGQGGDLSFMPNDLVLLLKPRQKNVLRDIQQGTARPPAGTDADDPSAYKLCGLVGHTEVSYRDVNGMTLKISRRKWAQLGQEEMYLVKIGGNVTALREFTALCRVDNLPTKRFILAQHLENAANRRKLSRSQPTQQLLETMGGTNALGAGFIKYARGKFNASQLTAIAASAHEYGEGGFTLIKGPPGTGSKWTAGLL
jgi:senataxin